VIPINVNPFVLTLTRKLLVATAQDNNLCTPLDLAVIFAPEKTAPLILDKCKMTESGLEVSLVAAAIFGRTALVDRIAAKVGEEPIHSLLNSVEIFVSVIGGLQDFPRDLPEYIIGVIGKSDYGAARTSFYIREWTEMNRGKWFDCYSNSKKIVEILKAHLLNVNGGEENESEESV
jgi:hypothetical protein